MRERINWIDWGKCMAICTVVFCHLPQSQEWFYYRFLQATIITVSLAQILDKPYSPLPPV